MKPFTEAIKIKGWKLVDLAERWGVSKREMSNIAANTSEKEWDAVNGLPNKSMTSNRGGFTKP